MAALRGLLRQASQEFGDAGFPYSRVADTLLDQQMAIFGGGVRQRSGIEGRAMRWGQAVWLDRKVRGRLCNAGCGGKIRPELLYPEYVRFAEMMGLNAALLPRAPGEFDAWAESGMAAWQLEGYREVALNCLTELSPLFWPVNIALIFHLVPEAFMECYGHAFARDGQRMARAVQGIFMEFSVF